MRGLHLALFTAAIVLPTGEAMASRGGEGQFFQAFASIDHDQWRVSHGWANGDYQSCEWQSGAARAMNGALTLKLSDHGAMQREYSCGEVVSAERQGYGTYEARIQAAEGDGLNTAFFTYVGPGQGEPIWDEIDFEILGKDPSKVQINYFADGKGGHEVVVPLGFDSSKSYHDYAIEWTPTRITWYVDGKEIFGTPREARLPTQPSNMILSLWSGSKSMDSWLGKMKYDKPATAQVAWAAYTPLGQDCSFYQSMLCEGAVYPEV